MQWICCATFYYIYFFFLVIAYISGPNWFKHRSDTFALNQCPIDVNEIQNRFWNPRCRVQMEIIFKVWLNDALDFGTDVDCSNLKIWTCGLMKQFGTTFRNDAIRCQSLLKCSLLVYKWTPSYDNYLKVVGINHRFFLIMRYITTWVGTDIMWFDH